MYSYYFFPDYAKCYQNKETCIRIFIPEAFALSGDLHARILYTSIV
jgi:hypothetical protein